MPEYLLFWFIPRSYAGKKSNIQWAHFADFSLVIQALFMLFRLGDTEIKLVDFTNVVKVVRELGSETIVISSNRFSSLSDFLDSIRNSLFPDYFFLTPAQFIRKNAVPKGTSTLLPFHWHVSD